jgi:hypothetical protein
MAKPLSLTEIVTSLESRLAVHEERQAFHAEQARHHEEQRSRHAAEIETVTRKLATFRAALSEAEDLPGPLSLETAAPQPPSSKLAPGAKVYVARLVAQVVEDQPAGEPFGISAVTAEVNRRYRDHLRRPVEPRQVSNVLRWMLRTDRLLSVRKGKPSHEALYVKG